VAVAVAVAVGFQLLLLFWIIHSPSLRSIGPFLYFLLWAISPVVLIVAVVILQTISNGGRGIENVDNRR
jgi:hypothetical protein